MSRRLSFTEHRRRRLTKQVDQLDRLESRALIAEPLSLTGLSISWMKGVAGLGLISPLMGSNALSGLGRQSQKGTQVQNPTRPAFPPRRNLLAPIIGNPLGEAAAGGAGATFATTTPSSFKSQDNASDWLTLIPGTDASGSESHGISLPWHPAKPNGGGAALSPRGGSNPASALRSTTRGAITPLQVPPSSAGASSAGGSAALLAAVAGASGNAAAGAGAAARNAPGALSSPHNPATASVAAADDQGADADQGQAADSLSPSGGALPGSTPDPTISNFSPPSQQAFAFFPMFVHDNNSGVVLYPGVNQLATLGGSVDLLAQVSGATVATYNWNTTGLGTDVTSLSVTNTYQLTFNWEINNLGSAHTDSVTLSIKDTSNHFETYTYDFLVPVGSGASGGTATATWPTSLAPSSELLSAPVFASDNASVDALSGSLDTVINLPSYNPNIPAIALTYDSIAAHPQPMIVVEHTLSPSSAVPTKVSAKLTFNGTALTNYFYDTSLFNPGDVQQITLLATNATASATNRYSYSAQVVDIGTTNVTTTYSGTTTLLNYAGNGFGAGWTLQGLERIIPETGGVILDLGEGGRTLWFSGSFGSGGGTYTNPAGEFSSLTINSGGSFTRVLTDGTQITFNSGGYETATIDLNNQHITYAYNVSNQISTITDNYSNTVTFAYSSGLLQTIKDSAGRTATFAHSSTNLTQVQFPDSSTIGYTYASGSQLTQITDPRSKTSTIVYDSAGRVDTIVRRDSTSETFTNVQESGWTNSGTSGSPAAATLLAQAGSTHTSPNGNTTTMQPDWLGFGLAGNVIDPLGNVAMFDRDSNGLATVAVDQVNRITQATYDAQGNVTNEIFADGNSQQFTYNADSQPLTFTDANGFTASFTYSGGNLTVVKDPLGKLTSIAYTSTGRPTTTTDANSHTTTILYNSQDRATTVQFPDGTTNLMSYDSQGDVTKTVDGRSNVTSYSYDAMNRQTGTIDALNDLTTLTYDSGGNLTVDQEPTPAGTTARTTTYAYDNMNRVTTVTAPLSAVSVFGYDSDGNQTTAKDPLGQITTTMYDSLDRPYVVIDPMGGHTTASYDGDSEVIQVADRKSRITTTAYDNRGWIANVTDPLGNTATYSYTATGKTSTVSNPGTSGGGSESYFYDKDDRLTTMTDANGNTTIMAYDGVGNEISVKDANNHTTSYAFDSRNRVTTITDGAGDTTLIGYDSGGNQQTVTDGLGHTATTLYDALNRATTMTSAISGTTTITYDAAGRETSLTDPVGNQTQWAYDGLDRMITTTLPNGFTVTAVYDSGGQLTDTTDADGRRTTYSYDADGDRTGETWVSASPAEKITYTYDADNELTGAADSFATLTFTYDSGGNELTAATSGPGTGQPSVTLTSGYNAQHSLTSVTDNLSSVGITTYVYDGGQRVTTITTSYGGVSGPQVVTGYAANNQISTQSRSIAGSGTQVNTTYSYDAAERQTTITQRKFVPSMSGGTTTPLTTIVYSYDQASRVTSEKDAEGTASFVYDNSNQLTTVTGSRTESYSYDVNGNRTGTSYSTTVMNETLTSPGVVTYTYDHAGNMTAANSGGTFTTYTYDYRNRLTGVKQGGTVTATYIYDALDRRIEVQEGGGRTWTVYNGTDPDAMPYADFNSSGTLLTRYLNGPGMVNGAVVDELLARTSSGGTTAWYLPDKLDSVRDIASSAGTVLDHVVYDSFGNVVTESNAGNGDRFKFAGMQFDSTTRQYFDQARWYGPAIGRFLREDPTGFGAGDANLYRYVGNGPVDATDPTGLSWSDYWYYLTHPSQLDPDISKAQQLSLATAAVSLTIATGGLMAPTVGGVSAANFVMASGAACSLVGATTTYLRGGSFEDTLHGAVDGAQWGTGAAETVLIGYALIRQMMLRFPSCFPAGTLVATADGRRPIESIVTGESVWGYDLITSEWQLRRVLQTHSRPCRGNATSITVAGETIDSTSRHPYFVVRGDQLDERPRLEHLADVPATATTPGRWVDAVDLRVGDELLLQNGRTEPVDHVRNYALFDTVYNLEVDDLHCYAVGQSSVLVHNTNGDEADPVGSQRIYVTYTKSNPKTLEIYSGRTSGYGTPEDILVKRDSSHHMNSKGFGPADLDQSSTNGYAIRGREQHLIDGNGGAKSQGGTSGNQINGVSSSNKNRTEYLRESLLEFPE